MLIVLENPNRTIESCLEAYKKSFIFYKKKGGNDPDMLDTFNLRLTDGFEVPLEKIRRIIGYVETKSPYFTSV
jgi:hypothetical protein